MFIQHSLAFSQHPLLIKTGYVHVLNVVTVAKLLHLSEKIMECCVKRNKDCAYNIHYTHIANTECRDAVNVSLACTQHYFVYGLSNSIWH